MGTRIILTRFAAYNTYVGFVHQLSAKLVERFGRRASLVHGRTGVPQDNQTKINNGWIFGLVDLLTVKRK